MKDKVVMALSVRAVRLFEDEDDDDDDEEEEEEEEDEGDACCELPSPAVDLMK